MKYSIVFRVPSDSGENEIQRCVLLQFLIYYFVIGYYADLTFATCKITAMFVALGIEMLITLKHKGFYDSITKRV